MMNPSRFVVPPFPPPPNFTVININPNQFQQYHHLPEEQNFDQSSTRLDSSDPTPTDLTTTIAILQSIIDLSETTLSSLPSTLNPSANARNTEVCRCPFDPNHRMPPEFLFRHTFSCPSAGSAIDLSILRSIRYPNTLKSESELGQQNRFVQTLEDDDTELFFELEDDDLGAVSDFFYRSCPGVVCSSDLDNRVRRTFTIPGVLSAECANFVSKCEGGLEKLDEDFSGFYPSELYVLKCEVESWNDFPATYSDFVIRAIKCQRIVGEDGVRRWLIANSPLYGVVIDVYVRDHMFLLFNLCLKSVYREAFGVGKGHVAGMMTCSCPVLVQVLKWLSSQIAVLYGELNGGLLILNLFKRFVLEVGSELLLFSSEGRESGEPLSNCLLQDVESSIMNENFSGIKKNDEKFELFFGVRNIFVSQVAAAVSALHERSFIEEKFRALRSPQPSTNFQRKEKHVNFSKWADGMRRKNLAYKPIIENDGFSQRSENQGTGRVKTREELLAEERDYKRRRTSYRGKKSKRTTTQVMRDIIEEYMEQITKAERKSHSNKDFRNEGMHSSESRDEPTKHPHESHESNRHHTHKSRISDSVDSYAKSSRYENSLREQYSHKGSIQGRDEYRVRTRIDDGSRSNREHSSRSPNKSSASGYTRKHNEDRFSSRYRDSTHSIRNSRSSTEYERSKHRSRRLDSTTHNSFDDRYDPSI